MADLKVDSGYIPKFVGEGRLARSLSPLEILHPTGTATRRLILGNNCPHTLFSEPESDGTFSADLVVVAPTTEELSNRRWFEDAIKSLAQRLTPDGIACLLVPPRGRRNVRNLLRRQGLLVEARFVHLPDWESSQYIIPLRPIPIQHALSKLLPVRPWRAWLALALLELPGGTETLAALLPSVTFVARRPGARPLFQWLFQPCDDHTRCSHSVIIATSWRKQAGTVTLHRLPDIGSHPGVVAKTNLERIRSLSSLGPTTDCANLSRLGADARNAGANIPTPMAAVQVGDRQVCLQTMIKGRPLALHLLASPKSLPGALEKLTEWLARWHRLTFTEEPLDEQRFNQEVLAPTTLLEPELDGGGQYRQWLISQFQRLIGLPMPLVATHNDLTMWNVLQDDQGILGVVDWEVACARGFPLVDFFYAVVDAAAAANGYANRLHAFQACFAPNGAYANRLYPLYERLRVRLDMPADVAILCFHVCWLHHAANECHNCDPGQPRPFFEVVQWLAKHHPSVCTIQPSAQR